MSVSSWEVLGALALLEMGLAEFIDLVSMWKSTHTARRQHVTRNRELGHSACKVALRARRNSYLQ